MEDKQADGQPRGKCIAEQINRFRSAAPQPKETRQSSSEKYWWLQRQQQEQASSAQTAGTPPAPGQLTAVAPSKNGTPNKGLSSGPGGATTVPAALDSLRAAGSTAPKVATPSASSNAQATSSTGGPRQPPLTSEALLKLSAHHPALVNALQHIERDGQGHIATNTLERIRLALERDTGAGTAAGPKQPQGPSSNTAASIPAGAGNSAAARPAPANALSSASLIDNIKKQLSTLQQQQQGLSKGVAASASAPAPAAPAGASAAAGGRSSTASVPSRQPTEAAAGIRAPSASLSASIEELLLRYGALQQPQQQQPQPQPAATAAVPAAASVVVSKPSTPVFGSPASALRVQKVAAEHASATAAAQPATSSSAAHTSAFAAAAVCFAPSSSAASAGSSNTTTSIAAAGPAGSMDGDGAAEPGRALSASNSFFKRRTVSLTIDISAASAANSSEDEASGDSTGQEEPQAGAGTGKDTSAAGANSSSSGSKAAASKQVVIAGDAEEQSNSSEWNKKLSKRPPTPGAGLGKPISALSSRCDTDEDDEEEELAAPVAAAASSKQGGKGGSFGQKLSKRPGTPGAGLGKKFDFSDDEGEEEEAADDTPAAAAASKGDSSSSSQWQKKLSKRPPTPGVNLGKPMSIFSRSNGDSEDEEAEGDAMAAPQKPQQRQQQQQQQPKAGSVVTISAAQTGAGKEETWSKKLFKRPPTPGAGLGKPVSIFAGNSSDESRPSSAQHPSSATPAKKGSFKLGAVSLQVSEPQQEEQEQPAGKATNSNSNSNSSWKKKLSQRPGTPGAALGKPISIFRKDSDDEEPAAAPAPEPASGAAARAARFADEPQESPKAISKKKKKSKHARAATPGVALGRPVSIFKDSSDEPASSGSSRNTSPEPASKPAAKAASGPSKQQISSEGEGVRFAAGPAAAQDDSKVRFAGAVTTAAAGSEASSSVIFAAKPGKADGGIRFAAAPAGSKAEGGVRFAAVAAAPPAGQCKAGGSTQVQFAADPDDGNSQVIRWGPDQVQVYAAPMRRSASSSDGGAAAAPSSGSKGPAIRWGSDNVKEYELTHSGQSSLANSVASSRSPSIGGAAEPTILQQQEVLEKVEQAAKDSSSSRLLRFSDADAEVIPSAAAPQVKFAVAGESVAAAAQVKFAVAEEPAAVAPPPAATSSSSSRGVGFADVDAQAQPAQGPSSSGKAGSKGAGSLKSWDSKLSKRPPTPGVGLGKPVSIFKQADSEDEDEAPAAAAGSTKQQAPQGQQGAAKSGVRFDGGDAAAVAAVPASKRASAVTVQKPGSSSGASKASTSKACGKPATWTDKLSKRPPTPGVALGKPISIFKQSESSDGDDEDEQDEEHEQEEATHQQQNAGQQRQQGSSKQEEEEEEEEQQEEEDEEEDELQPPAPVLGALPSFVSFGRKAAAAEPTPATAITSASADTPAPPVTATIAAASSSGPAFPAALLKRNKDLATEVAESAASSSKGKGKKSWADKLSARPPTPAVNLGKKVSIFKDDEEEEEEPGSEADEQQPPAAAAVASSPELHVKAALAKRNKGLAADIAEAAAASSSSKKGKSWMDKLSARPPTPGVALGKPISIFKQRAPAAAGADEGDSEDEQEAEAQQQPQQQEEDVCDAEEQQEEEDEEEDELQPPAPVLGALPSFVSFGRKAAAAEPTPATAITSASADTPAPPVTATIAAASSSGPAFPAALLKRNKDLATEVAESAASSSKGKGKKSWADKLSARPPTPAVNLGKKVSIFKDDEEEEEEPGSEADEQQPPAAAAVASSPELHVKAALAKRNKGLAADIAEAAAASSSSKKGKSWADKLSARPPTPGVALGKKVSIFKDAEEEPDSEADEQQPPAAAAVASSPELHVQAALAKHNKGLAADIAEAAAASSSSKKGKSWADKLSARPPTPAVNLGKKVSIFKDDEEESGTEADKQQPPAAAVVASSPELHVKAALAKRNKGLAADIAEAAATSNSGKKGKSWTDKLSARPPTPGMALGKPVSIFKQGIQAAARADQCESEKEEEEEEEEEEQQEEEDEEEDELQPPAPVLGALPSFVSFGRKAAAAEPTPATAGPAPASAPAPPQPKEAASSSGPAFPAALLKRNKDLATEVAESAASSSKGKGKKSWADKLSARPPTPAVNLGKKVSIFKDDEEEEEEPGSEADEQQPPAAAAVASSPELHVKAALAKRNKGLAADIAEAAAASSNSGKKGRGWADKLAGRPPTPAFSLKHPQNIFKDGHDDDEEDEEEEAAVGETAAASQGSTAASGTSRAAAAAAVPASGGSIKERSPLNIKAALARRNADLACDIAEASSSGSGSSGSGSGGAGKGGKSWADKLSKRPPTPGFNLGKSKNMFKDDPEEEEHQEEAQPTAAAAQAVEGKPGPGVQAALLKRNKDLATEVAESAASSSKDKGKKSWADKLSARPPTPAVNLGKKVSIFKDDDQEEKEEPGSEADAQQQPAEVASSPELHVKAALAKHNKGLAADIAEAAAASSSSKQGKSWADKLSARPPTPGAFMKPAGKAAAARALAEAAAGPGSEQKPDEEQEEEEEQDEEDEPAVEVPKLMLLPSFKRNSSPTPPAAAEAAQPAPAPAAAAAPPAADKTKVGFSSSKPVVHKIARMNPDLAADLGKARPPTPGATLGKPLSMFKDEEEEEEEEEEQGQGVGSGSSQPASSSKASKKQRKQQRRQEQQQGAARSSSPDLMAQGHAVDSSSSSSSTQEQQTGRGRKGQRSNQSPLHKGLTAAELAAEEAAARGSPLRKCSNPSDNKPARGSPLSAAASAPPPADSAAGNAAGSSRGASSSASSAAAASQPDASAAPQQQQQQLQDLAPSTSAAPAADASKGKSSSQSHSRLSRSASPADREPSRASRLSRGAGDAVSDSTSNTAAEAEAASEAHTGSTCEPLAFAAPAPPQQQPVQQPSATGQPGPSSARGASPLRNTSKANDPDPTRRSPLSSGTNAWAGAPSDSTSTTTTTTTSSSSSTRAGTSRLGSASSRDPLPEPIRSASPIPPAAPAPAAAASRPGPDAAPPAALARSVSNLAGALRRSLAMGVGGLVAVAAAELAPEPSYSLRLDPEEVVAAARAIVAELDASMAQVLRRTSGTTERSEQQLPGPEAATPSSTSSSSSSSSSSDSSPQQHAKQGQLDAVHALRQSLQHSLAQLAAAQQQPAADEQQQVVPQLSATQQSPPCEQPFAVDTTMSAAAGSSSSAGPTMTQSCTQLGGPQLPAAPAAAIAPAAAMPWLLPAGAGGPAAGAPLAQWGPTAAQLLQPPPPFWMGQQQHHQQQPQGVAHLQQLAAWYQLQLATLDQVHAALMGQLGWPPAGGRN